MKMRTLDEYIKSIEIIEKIGVANPQINALTFDSRKANENTIFIAVKGSSNDGHNFIEQAVELGCKAFIVEKLPQNSFDDATFVVVKNSSKALAQLAAFHYGYPSQKLKMVGVTGTNGKTTIATLLYKMALSFGYKAGLCSTVANYVNEEKFETNLTTPDVITLNELFAKMVESGCQYCFMEVSSHAIDQQRVGGIKFDGGIFTNLTHDHLDYHKTFEIYLKTKKSFFDNLPKNAFALSNADDKNGDVMLQNTKATKKFYSTKSVSDFHIKIIESLFEGMQLEVDDIEVWTSFIGRFNASNLAAVYGSAILLGWDRDEVLQKMSLLKSVDGRFETIRSANGITAVVDYAHTPDALKNVLETINQIRTVENQLITVVGAGGNRDPFKRPLMAAEAVNNSSRVILTSDNPRFEEAEDIIEQMKKGVKPIDAHKVLSITNRKEAIRTACSFAQPGDVILVAGKGHETYQEIKGVRTHFDDREIINEYFEQIKI